jgi:hypothetical protein
MLRKRITLAEWIQKTLQNADNTKPCTALALTHVDGNRKEEVIAKELVPNVPQDFEALANFFEEYACNFTQDIPGIHVFHLISFYGSKTPGPYLPFTTERGQLTGGSDSTFLNAHDASEKGLLQQLMKHNDSMAQTLLMLTQSVTATAVQREQMYHEDQAAFVAILRDVFLTQKKEAHDMRMDELRLQMENEKSRMFMKALPSMVNAAAGAPIIPTDFSDTQLVDMIASKIGPEELQLMVQLGKINEQQAAMLTARFQKTKEEEEKTRRLIKQAPPEDSDANNIVERN